MQYMGVQLKWMWGTTLSISEHQSASMGNKSIQWIEQIEFVWGKRHNCYVRGVVVERGAQPYFIDHVLDWKNS